MKKRERRARIAAHHEELRSYWRIWLIEQGLTEESSPMDFSAWIARAIPEAKAAQAVRAQAPAPPSTRERPVISVAQAVRNAIAGVRDV